MIGISIDINSKAFLRDFDEIQKKQLPFAIATTLTALAKGAQQQLIKELPSHFDLHSQWTAKGIRIDPAKKSDLRTKGFIQSAVKDVDPVMVKQEEGGDRVKMSHGRPVRGNLVIPVQESLIASTGRIKPSMMPGKILNKPHSTRTRKVGRNLKPKPFLMRAKANGRLIVAVRTEADRYPIQTLFVLSPRAQMHKRWDFRETVLGYVHHNIDRIFAEKMLQALATRKGVSQVGVSA